MCLQCGVKFTLTRTESVVDADCSLTLHIVEHFFDHIDLRQFTRLNEKTSLANTYLLRCNLQLKTIWVWFSYGGWLLIPFLNETTNFVFVFNLKIQLFYLINVDCRQSMLTPLHFSWSTSTRLHFSSLSTVDARRLPFYSPFHHTRFKTGFTQR